MSHHHGLPIFIDIRLGNTPKTKDSCIASFFDPEETFDSIRQNLLLLWLLEGGKRKRVILLIEDVFKPKTFSI